MMLNDVLNEQSEIANVGKDSYNEKIVVGLNSAPISGWHMSGNR